MSAKDLEKGEQMKDNVKNEETNLPQAKLQDLLVSEEQAEETKAGSGGRLFVATNVGVYVTAENERE